MQTNTMYYSIQSFLILLNVTAKCSVNRNCELDITSEFMFDSTHFKCLTCSKRINDVHVIDDIVQHQ